MRILLTSNASHVPPRGGSTRSNLAWLDRLAASGHLCRVVGGALATDTPEKLAQVRRELEDQELTFAGSLQEVARRGAIEIHSVADPARRIATLKEQIREFQPDWVLVSSEDIGQALLAAAQETAPGRVVYLAHTPQFYPFGPASWNADRRGTELVARSAAVAVALHTASYIRSHVNCRVEVIHPPIYGAPPFARYGRFDRGFITMINPCAVKGVSIFRALAARWPGVQFAALPGWGTTADDRRALVAQPNVALLRNSKKIDDVLEKTRILLVPSLWLEGFGLVVVEAMLRGIPVVASDSGGLVEAKLGTRFVIPIRPIERYGPAFDEQGLPRAVLPDQDLEQWSQALEALISDSALYERESAAASDAALRFVSSLRPLQFEEFLLTLAPGEPAAKPDAVIDRLSPEKRALLLRRLRAQAPE